MRTFSRTQHVVSTIICRGCHPSDVGSDFGVKQGELFAGQLLQAAHEPYRIPVPSRAAVVCRRRASFPRLMESLGAPAGATSLSPVAAGNQVLALSRGPANPARPRRRGDRVRQNLCSARVGLWAHSGHSQTIDVGQVPMSRRFSPLGALGVGSRYLSTQGKIW